MQLRTRGITPLLLAVLLATAGGFTLPLPLAAASRPNIVFIMSDDHALEAVGAYDSWLKRHVVTPAIDRLAAEGMRFDNFCCNNSICSPSRASFLTGQYSHKNGAYGLNASINANSPWVSTGLRKAGYQTAVFGKWRLKSRPQGFDHFKVTKGQGQWFDPTFYTDGSVWAYGGGDGQAENKQGYSSDVYTDEALAWLKGRDARTDRYKLIKFPDIEEFEFYDLKRDPFEMTNLAGSDGHADAIKEAEAHIARLIRQVDIQPAEMPGKRGEGQAPTLKQDQKNSRNQKNRKP